jgi:hypothetical protein
METETTYNVRESESSRNNEMGTMETINRHLQAAIEVAERQNSFALNPLLRLKLDLSRQAHTA